MFISNAFKIDMLSKNTRVTPIVIIERATPIGVADLGVCTIPFIPDMWGFTGQEGGTYDNVTEEECLDPTMFGSEGVWAANGSQTVINDAKIYGFSIS